MNENCRDNMMVLKEGLEKTGQFDIVSKDDGVPLVAFTLRDHGGFNEFQISDMLRRFGWMVPAMSADAQHVTVFRVVIREDFPCTFADRLVINITKVLHELDFLPAKVISSNTVTLTAEKDDDDANNGGNVMICKKCSGDPKVNHYSLEEICDREEEDEWCLLESCFIEAIYGRVYNFFIYIN